MPRNIEIKAKASDFAPIRAKVAALASAPPEIVEQTDTFFVVSTGRLKVRVFADGSGELIPYERANQHGPKESVYTRVACQNASALADILGRLLPIRGVVRKRREVFVIGRTRVHLDEVEGLGCFIELEVVLEAGESPANGHHEANALLRALQIPDEALVPEAYIDLLESAAVASRPR